MTEQYDDDVVNQPSSTTDDSAPPPESDSASASGEIIAAPDPRFRRKHYIFAIIMFVVGFWFAYDGWIGWPKHNQEVRNVEAEIERAKAAGDDKKREELQTKHSKMHKEYNDWAIRLQKFIAISLPIAGLAYGYWTWHATRGRYRLAGQTLEIPGHGEIPLSDIRSLDKSRWERKGIAVVTYQAHHPQRERTFKLDDFAYDREPTDKILERIEAYIAPPPEMQPDAPEQSEQQAEADHQQAEEPQQSA